MKATLYTLAGKVKKKTGEVEWKRVPVDTFEGTPSEILSEMSRGAHVMDSRPKGYIAEITEGLKRLHNIDIALPEAEDEEEYIRQWLYALQHAGLAEIIED